MGGEGAEADPDIFAKLYKNVFGANIKLVSGYPGTAEIMLAMERNELDACYIRPMVLRGYGDAGMLPKESPIETYIACWRWGANWICTPRGCRTSRSRTPGPGRESRHGTGTSGERHWKG